MADVSTDDVSNFPVTSTYGGRYSMYSIIGFKVEVPSKYTLPINPTYINGNSVTCTMLNTETNQLVVMKKFSNAFAYPELAKCILREIKLLRHFDHENVLSISDVVPPPCLKEFRDIYMTIELVDNTLQSILYSDRVLTDADNQRFVYQILRGLKYLHSANIIHRYLTPADLTLLDANNVLKILCFDLHPPTYYDPSNLAYAAPELLLNSSVYTSAIDIWSVGCILMELMTRQRLFPRDEPPDQLSLITKLFGSPTESDLQNLDNEDGRRQMRRRPPQPHQPLTHFYPNLNPLACDLVEKMLTFDPTKRITGKLCQFDQIVQLCGIGRSALYQKIQTHHWLHLISATKPNRLLCFESAAEEALSHPYLAELHDIANEPTCSEPYTFDSELENLTAEDVKELLYKEALSFNPGFIPMD